MHRLTPPELLRYVADLVEQRGLSTPVFVMPALMAFTSPEVRVHHHDVDEWVVATAACNAEWKPSSREELTWFTADTEHFRLSASKISVEDLPVPYTVTEPPETGRRLESVEP